MMSECMTQEDAERMDANQAIQILKPLRAMMLDQYGCPISAAYFALGKAIEALEQPTVDAVPVVHATLEDMGLAEDDREWVCSNCKAEFTLCVCGKDRTGYIKHCPYCGAMIIGERKGGDE